MDRRLAEMSQPQLIALVEDTQASLSAALARIEAYRLQNKQLRTELSDLRNEVHGGHPPQEPAGPGPGSAATAAKSMAKAASVASISSNPSNRGKEALGRSLYVTTLEGEHPVHIVTQSGKVPASMVITRDHIDLVEVRHRVLPKGFVGISHVKQPSRPDDLGEGGGDAARASASGAPPGGGDTGVWTMMWAEGHVTFEASLETREMLHKHTERWLTGQEQEEGMPDGSQDPGELVPPHHLTLGEVNMRLVGEPSTILSEQAVRALASSVPPLERMRDWGLAYSTQRHGISLATLYRKMASGVPTITVIKDSGGFVFGCYTPEPWRLSPRFYGSGETFVFQLEPHRVMWPWRSRCKAKNDFFQYATPECMAVGGLGHFAIHVDQELLQGSSGTCGTFGSPCLAAGEEFKVQVLEVWQVVS